VCVSARMPEQDKLTAGFSPLVKSNFQLICNAVFYNKHLIVSSNIND